MARSRRAREDKQQSFIKRLDWKIWTTLGAAAALIATTVLTGYTNQAIPWLPELPQPGDPVKIEILTNPTVFEAGTLDWTGYSYVIPRLPDHVPPPPPGMCRDRRVWAYSLNGADADFSKIELVLRANRNETVTINDLKINVTKSGPPLSGTHANCPVGGASGEPVGIVLELNPTKSTWSYIDPFDPERKRRDRRDNLEKKRRLPLVINTKELDFIDVESHAKSGYFEWKLALLVTDGSGQRWITVDDEGRPFKITSVENAEEREWRDSRWSPL
jgi:hypothetical protein